MAVRIRLMRLGKIRNPQYRIVIADSRKKRDGRAIEEIGLYHPKEDPSRIEVNSERAQYWLSVGAQPSQPVQRLLELTGDWQKHKGLPAPPPLKVAEPKADKHARYEAEAKAVAVSEEKTAEKKKPAKKAAKSAKAESKTDEKAKTDSKAKAESKTDEKAKTDSKAKAEKADKPAKSEGNAKAKKAESKPAESEESAGAETGSES